jgi:hypothetical protein
LAAFEPCCGRRSTCITRARALPLLPGKGTTLFSFPRDNEPYHHHKAHFCQQRTAGGVWEKSTCRRRVSRTISFVRETILLVLHSPALSIPRVVGQAKKRVRTNGLWCLRGSTEQERRREKKPSFLFVLCVWVALWWTLCVSAPCEDPRSPKRPQQALNRINRLFLLAFFRNRRYERTVFAGLETPCWNGKWVLLHPQREEYPTKTGLNATLKFSWPVLPSARFGPVFGT